MMLNAPPPLSAALRLGLAFLLALPLGWDSEQRSRSAGLRTYPLLCLCICGFLLLARSAAWGSSEQADAFYGVLAGIGFVGSGAVIKSPDGVRGVSTAVSLWVTGAVGAGVAYGTPLISAAVSLMSVLALRGPSLAARRKGAS
jgi:putative Mg2+ transporter-C (MgtC) family protein